MSDATGNEVREMLTAALSDLAKGPPIPTPEELEAKARQIVTDAEIPCDELPHGSSLAQIELVEGVVYRLGYSLVWPERNQCARLIPDSVLVAARQLRIEAGRLRVARAVAVAMATINGEDAA